MIRIRLDKTSKHGGVIAGRACNLRCIWCHNDYFDHRHTIRSAISNRMFVDAVSRVLDAVSANEATVRIAGAGEPTLVGCAELAELTGLLHDVPQVRSVKLTTNGVLLKEMIHPLKGAGLDGVTISLNSTDPDIYHFYSGADSLSQVLDSLDSSLAVGLAVKVPIGRSWGWRALVGDTDNCV